MQPSRFRTQQYAILFLYCVLFFFLYSCSPTITATPFIAPRSQKTIPSETPKPAPGTPSPEVSLSLSASPTNLTGQQNLSTPEATLAFPKTSLPFPTISPSETLFSVPTNEATGTSSPAANCSDSLIYVQDLNYPDGTLVSARQSIEKQWLVENNGSCDWDGRYSLRLLDGYTALEAPGKITLGPVQAGSQLTITINFTAPSILGPYRTAWQAYNADGIAFGDAIYMEVNVGQ